MTKDEAQQKLTQARTLLDQAESLVADVQLACEEAGMGDDVCNSGDMFGVARDSISELEGVAQGMLQ